jgi:hypothetical protein
LASSRASISLAAARPFSKDVSCSGLNTPIKKNEPKADLAIFRFFGFAHWLLGHETKRAVTCGVALLMGKAAAASDFELELELIQAHMTQKPLLWIEVGAHVVRKRSECAGVVWAGAGVAWRLCVVFEAFLGCLASSAFFVWCSPAGGCVQSTASGFGETVTPRHSTAWLGGPGTTFFTEKPVLFILFGSSFIADEVVATGGWCFRLNQVPPWFPSARQVCAIQGGGWRQRR